MDLLDARSKLGAALQGGPAEVLLTLVDSLEPPALMLGWGEPWLQPDTRCLQTGRLVITAVAGRLIPGEGIAKLEELVRFTLDRLSSDPEPWPLDTVGGPRVFTIGNVNYLAARITVRVPIQGGP